MYDSVITVPKGFSFSATAAGFKYSGRDDLAFILSGNQATAAAVFTQNTFQAAPVVAARENVASGKARAVMINAGLANACTGAQGLADCRRSLELAAEAVGIAPEDILPASTGVIGPRFDMKAWAEAVPKLAAALGECGPLDAAKAVMTTDTFPKIAWGKVDTPDGEVRVLGMAKGVGMLCPNMATMIGVLLCDAEVGSLWWREALAAAVDQSFNSITVDGDTSTNDCVLALANGAAKVSMDTAESRQKLLSVMTEVCQALSYMIIQDAEGGAKILRISVRGAEDNAQAELAARSVGHSPLVKTAMHGEDANWGRIVMALGKSGAAFDPAKVSVSIGGIPVFKRGAPVTGDLDGLLAPRMRRREITIDIDLDGGTGRYLLLASDLSEDYIKINADYRS